MNKMNRWIVGLAFALIPGIVYNMAWFSKVYSEYNKFEVNSTNIMSMVYCILGVIVLIVAIAVLYKFCHRLMSVLCDNNNILNILVDIVIDIDQKLEFDTRSEINKIISKNLSLMKEMGVKND